MFYHCLGAFVMIGISNPFSCCLAKAHFNHFIIIESSLWFMTFMIKDILKLLDNNITSVATAKSRKESWTRLKKFANTKSKLREIDLPYYRIIQREVLFGNANVVSQAGMSQDEQNRKNVCLHDC